MAAVNDTPAGSVLLLSGGIGGAKLALGLDRSLPAGALTVIANIGDDFRHLGLAISPDIDTLVYTLADLVNPDTGWGRRDETWHFMEELARLGGETWFRLGDRDLAMHVERTRRLDAGETLATVTRETCQHLGIGSRIVPASDSRVPTRVVTEAGVLAFQDYFVRRRAGPVVSALRFVGADEARPPATAMAALGDPVLRALLIAPSNPWLSIDPMLAIPDLRAALERARVPRVAVSPIVGGQAIKGPTAKLMAELGLPVNQASIARHYRGLIDGLILDHADAGEAAAVEALGIRAVTTATVMHGLEDRVALARFVLDFADTLRRG